MQKELNDFSRVLSKIAVEAALNVELEEHWDMADMKKQGSTNSRNGYTPKALKTEIQIH